MDRPQFEYIAEEEPSKEHECQCHGNQSKYNYDTVNNLIKVVLHIHTSPVETKLPLSVFRFF